MLIGVRQFLPQRLIIDIREQLVLLLTLAHVENLLYSLHLLPQHLVLLSQLLDDALPRYDQSYFLKLVGELSRLMVADRFLSMFSGA